MAHVCMYHARYGTGTQHTPPINCGNCDHLEQVVEVGSTACLRTGSVSVGMLTTSLSTGSFSWWCNYYYMCFLYGFSCSILVWIKPYRAPYIRIDPAIPLACCLFLQLHLFTTSVVWCGVMWSVVVWCGAIWCAVMWCVVWCGVVCCGEVWRDVYQVCINRPPSFRVLPLLSICTSKLPYLVPCAWLLSCGAHPRSINWRYRIHYYFVLRIMSSYDH